jgi:hypothetical protein
MKRLRKGWTGTVGATAILWAAALAAPQAAQAADGPSPTTQQATQATPASQPLPPFKLERWEEDYSYLKTAPKSDFFDPIKYVPFTDDGSFYASFGGLFRDRYEAFNHPNFGSGPQDHDGYNLARLDLYADLHMTQYVRVFVEGRSALLNGRFGGERLTDLDTLDPQQAFADFSLPIGDNAKATVRAGRQELVFGAERLIGALDWANVRRTFDGVRGTITCPENQLDLFLTRPVQIEKYDFDNANNTQVFGGIYDTLKLPMVLPNANTKLEAYGLYLKRDGVTFPGVTGAGNERRYTVGARVSSNPKPFDFDVEGDWQWGDFRGENIKAWSIASEGGYTLANVACTPRLFLGFDAASGDRHKNDGNLETFNQLFPTGHIYFGYADLVGRQNIIDLHPGIEATLLQNAKFAQKVGVRAEYHQFWRESASDALYQATGAPLRVGTAATRSTDIGSEIDVMLRWQIDRHWLTYFGYSHVFHGSFIQETGPAKDVDFTYAAVVLTF